MIGATPRAVLVYGLLGLSGFLGPPLAGWLWADHRDLAARFLIAYAALILSFLGGARWGLAVARPSPSVATVSLAMLPTLWAVGVLVLPSALSAWQMGALAAGLALQWLWDVRARGLPAWYPGLRTVLSLGALAGLAAGSLVLTR
ncbi:DUF3429 domain-containing protein [Phenylobacterium sp.]|uniref:DUF3429 domain-containing protein n=1 Tax=Phenylobacterium sp. TaxID=1871053 RepID=UPI00286E46D7|nr:DUF3429 domain-containing protein [Phenylobacterium sp.]